MRALALRHPLFHRLLRYGSVSLVATTTTLSTLAVLVGVFGVSAVWANLIAVGLGTVPSFELNRRWVWRRAGERIELRQLVPFCALSLSGLVLSSLAVHETALLTAEASLLARTVAADGANLGAYGVLWVLQFMLCDRVLFRRLAVATPPGQRRRHALD